MFVQVKGDDCLAVLPPQKVCLAPETNVEVIGELPSIHVEVLIEAEDRIQISLGMAVDGEQPDLHRCDNETTELLTTKHLTGLASIEVTQPLHLSIEQMNSLYNLERHKDWKKLKKALKGNLENGFAHCLGRVFPESHVVIEEFRGQKLRVSLHLAREGEDTSVYRYSLPAGTLEGMFRMRRSQAA